MCCLIFVFPQFLFAQYARVRVLALLAKEWSVANAFFFVRCGRHCAKARSFTICTHRLQSGKKLRLALALHPAKKKVGQKGLVSHWETKRNKTAPPKEGGEAHFPQPEMCLPFTRHGNNSKRGRGLTQHKTPQWTANHNLSKLGHSDSSHWSRRHKKTSTDKVDPQCFNGQSPLSTASTRNDQEGEG